MVAGYGLTLSPRARCARGSALPVGSHLPELVSAQTRGHDHGQGARRFGEIRAAAGAGKGPAARACALARREVCLWRLQSPEPQQAGEVTRAMRARGRPPLSFFQRAPWAAHPARPGECPPTGAWGRAVCGRGALRRSPVRPEEGGSPHSAAHSPIVQWTLLCFSHPFKEDMFEGLFLG